MIQTDSKGKPIEKPKREDFASDAEYARAFADYKRRLDSAKSDGLDKAFAGAVKGKKGEAPAREPDDEETRKKKVADMMKRWAVRGGR